MKLPLVIISLFTVAQLPAQTNTFPATGNVGIGTTNPADKLEVYNGGLRLTGTDNNGVRLSSSSSYGYNLFNVAALTPGYGILSNFGPGANGLNNPYGFQFTTDYTSLRSYLLIAGVNGSKHTIAVSGDGGESAQPWDLTFRNAAVGTNWSAAPDVVTIKSGAPANTLFLAGSGYVGLVPHLRADIFL